MSEHQETDRRFIQTQMFFKKDEFIFGSNFLRTLDFRNTIPSVSSKSNSVNLRNSIFLSSLSHVLSIWIYMSWTNPQNVISMASLTKAD